MTVLRSISKLNGVDWNTISAQRPMGMGTIISQTAKNYPFELTTLTNLGLGHCLTQLENYCSFRNVSKEAYSKAIKQLLTSVLSDSMTEAFFKVELPVGHLLLIHYELDKDYKFNTFEFVLTSELSATLFKN